MTTSLEERLALCTATQKAVYLFIRETVIRTGRGPRIRGIGEQFGIRSPNGVMCHLKALVKKGLISRDGTAYGIYLIDKPVPPPCPHCGKAATDPIEETVAYGP